MAQTFFIVRCRDLVCGLTTVTYRNKFTKYITRVALRESD